MHIENKVDEIHKELLANEIPYKIDAICNHLGILVAYNNDLNCFMFYKGYPIIYLKNASKREMWEQFTHELGHYVLHETNQLEMNDMFNNKQEYQAEKFSLLFQMPQHIIESEELYTQQSLMAFFNVDYNKALARLKHLYNAHCDGRGFSHGSI
ncbi:ImmA/IrrE family metallo-endopeptidase [Staphylococcus sp. LKG3-3]|uniref:ImmA/IrrE family metallo-endopeptidase n=1 Tax=Staphylococcus sp. LKG3-3 TaxID=3399685 RepID=UPI003D5A2D2E